MAVQRGDELIHGFRQLLDILLAKHDAVRLDKCILGSREPGLLIGMCSHDGVEESHDGFTRRNKGNGDTERLVVEEQLLQRVRPRQDGEVVVEPPGGRGPVRGLVVPSPAHIGPDLTITNVVVLDRHPVAPQVPKALDPGLLKGRDRFVEQGHHRVGQVDEGQHVLQAGGQVVAQEFEKTVDTVAPHAGRHGVLGCQAAQSRACRGVLAGEEEVVVLVKQGAVERNEGLPLVVGEASVVGVVLLVVALGRVDFYALVLHHDKPCIDALDLGHELLLRDGAGVGLLGLVG